MLLLIQSSCNCLSIFLSFLFGIVVELEFESSPVRKKELVVSANLSAPQKEVNNQKRKDNAISVSMVYTLLPATL